MSRSSILPLGVDFGSGRLRVAATARDRDGRLQLAGVAARDLPDEAVTEEQIASCDLVAAILEDLRFELGVVQRRCVFSLGPQAAIVRTVTFPVMKDAERRRAARFETGRWQVGWGPEPARVIRVHRCGDRADAYAVGVARADSLQGRVACIRRAGLRAIAGDYDGFALQRAFPNCDAVLDVGLYATRLHARDERGVRSIRIEGGGARITAEIAADLAMEAAAAEARKRHLGTAGAGESARRELVRAIAAGLAALRERGPVLRVGITGNGARLPELGAALESAAGVRIEPLEPGVLAGAYPPDVARAGAADWALAVSLSRWVSADAV